VLQRLEIKNIALIDNVSIETGKGFNVLTGETGAGKSIIIDSINAVIGERVSKDIIRTGTDKALVEAVFNVEYDRFADIFEESGIEPGEDGTLILSREITFTGRNTCRVNGKLATVSLLKTIGERLVDMHGQYDNQSLLKTENHIELLDMFGGEDIEKLKHEYTKLLEEYKEMKDKLLKLSGNSMERERKIDLIKYQIDEIKKAKLKIGEEQELSKKRLVQS
jgi:DNA repair protein RecN (Recombination protein N)